MNELVDILIFVLRYRDSSIVHLSCLKSGFSIDARFLASRPLNCCISYRKASLLTLVIKYKYRLLFIILYESYICVIDKAYVNTV